MHTEKYHGPSRIRKTIGRLGVAAIIIGTTYGGYEAYQNVPEFRQTIDSTAHDILQKLGWEIVNPTVFDPKALKGVLGENNTVQVNASEYSKVAPPIIEGSQLNMPLAIQFKDGKVRPLRYTLDNSGTSPNKAVNLLTVDGLIAGDVLLSPVDGEIQFTHPRWAENRDGSLKSAAFFIDADSKDPQGHKNVLLTYSTVTIKPLVESPIAQDGVPPPLVKIKRGDPIGIIETSDQHQFFSGQIQITGNAFLGNEIESLTIASNPEGKAIVLQ